MSKFILDINTFQKRVFQLLIFLLPSQLAYHFWPDWSLIFGIRVDYLSPTIYFTDILICILFLSEVVYKQKKYKDLVKSNKFWLIIVFAVLFVLLNTLSSQNHWITLVRWAKILEYIFIGYFVATNRLLKIYDWIISPLQYSLILFSSIGLLQFINGQTFGKVFYFLGERSFNVSSPGIALVSLFGRDYLRMYSTFPHPNALAGYFSLTFLIILSVGIINIKSCRILTIALLFLVLAIILSFSFSSFLSLLIILSLFILFGSNKRYFEVIYYLVLITIFISILSPLVSKLLLQITNGLPENIFNRLVLAQSAGQILSRNIFTGVGLNNFIVVLTQYLTYPRVSWWLQPVHNIFLLIISETGIVGLFIFIFVINKIYLNLKKINNRSSKILMLIILFIVLTGSIDHYWITIQQNILLLSIFLGIIFNKNCYKLKN